jgi:hypothetical protein
MLAPGMAALRPQPDPLWDDGTAPPIAVCVGCGLTSCPGCTPAPRVARSSLAWEDLGQPWWLRLWRTALATSLEPTRFFGELPQGQLSAALAFAACAEGFALGSLGLLAALGVSLAAPELAQQVLASPEACATLALTWFAFAACMVGLHVLWGVCLDVGAQRPRAGKSSWQGGARFGLYACGWDLLTSPIGVLATLLTRGPLRAWAPIGAAARAPLLAQQAYLALCLGADGAAQRRARRLSMFVVGGGLVCLILLLAAAVASLARRFGY